MKIKGVVKLIEYENNKGHEKKVVTLKLNHFETMFVQFHLKYMKLLNEVALNDEVEIKAISVAKRTLSGKQHNNILAKELTVTGHEVESSDSDNLYDRYLPRN